MENADLLKPALRKRQKRRDKRLAEELIECYRSGWRVKTSKGYRKQLRQSQFERAKHQEGMKEMHGGGRKLMTDNLEPLIRYLRSNVGQHWDKVYSNLSNKLDKSSVTGLHVFQHLTDFVHTKVILENRKVYPADLSWCRRGSTELVSHEKWPSFYVHPKSGVLMEAKSKRE
ncbi:MAG: hypothetical protein H7Z75_08980 [Ferruginibacter sp.]|nr:hypothetical protein [Cytophagales bacterium]